MAYAPVGVMKLRVLSFNIHKGMSAFGNNSTLNLLKKHLDSDPCDLVCLQEVCGKNEIHGDQLEKLADRIWAHHVYGKNAVYTRGHHGNAILSKFPIANFENINISRHRIERRGVLHAVVDLKPSPLHVFNTHLGLLQLWRKKQIEKLCERIDSHVNENEPIILCGDFNDWNEYATGYLRNVLGLQEAFTEMGGKHARTYPSWLPILCLDRIYFRGVKILSAQTVGGGEWSKLSDHLPIEVNFEVRT